MQGKKSRIVRQQPKRIPIRLLVERLEDRCLLDAAPVTAFQMFDNLQVTEEHASDRFLVRFQGDAVELKGTRLGDSFDLVSGLREVWLESGTKLDDALEAYRNCTSVLYAQPDYIVSVERTPNDPSFVSGTQWDMTGIGAPAAWDTTTGSNSVIVAVIDTGIDYTHPDLAANIWINSGETANDGVDNDGNGFTDDINGYDFANNDGNPMDDNGHGTHVAGTIGAVGNDGRGMTGVNWSVKLMALKFLDKSGSGSTSNAVRALNYAVTMGAKISNNSWGGGGRDNALDDAVRNARDRGHLFVAAAGNGNVNTDRTANYPSNYNYDNVISVAATDRNDNMASFTNWGPTTVDLAAPGVSIYSTTPNGSYANYSGTSMAAPHVAGAATLLWAADPSLTYLQVKDRLLQGGDYIGNVGTNAGKPTLTNRRLNIANSIKPDISAVALTAPTSVSAGQSFSVTRQYTVSGSTVADNFSIRYYLSRDNIFGNADDTLVASENLTTGADKSIGVHSGNFSLTLNTSGSSYLFVAADSGNTVNEFREDNNVSAAKAITVVGGTPATPTLSVSDVSRAEGNTGTTSFTFTVTLSEPASQTVTVDYATGGGSAAPDSDYTTTSGTLTFGIGESSKTITVAVKGDTEIETNETFLIGFRNAVGATLGRTEATGTILNDDSDLIASDSYGYQARAGTFENLDLVPGTAGVTTVIERGDDTSASFNLGNNRFNFYGTSYSLLHVSTNGLISFGSGNSSYRNTNLTTSPQQRVIAPLWDDWVSTSGNAAVLARVDDLNRDGTADRLVLEWNKLRPYNNTDATPITFQTILQLNSGGSPGSITFNYVSVAGVGSASNGAGATVGLKNNLLLSAPLLISFNNVSPYIGNGKAIQIVKPLITNRRVTRASEAENTEQADTPGQPQNLRDLVFANLTDNRASTPIRQEATPSAGPVVQDNTAADVFFAELGSRSPETARFLRRSTSPSLRRLTSHLETPGIDRDRANDEWRGERERGW